jgi:hypothetical protein
MTRSSRALSGMLVLALGLTSVGAASAGPPCGPLADDCPRSSYSPWRYWAPAMARMHDYFHGPKQDIYAPDRHPEINTTYTILPFSCPSAPPAATYIDRPTPPVTSKFKY